MPILYPIVRKWKEVELWKYEDKTKEITKDKYIPSGIEDNNLPPKFIVPIENITLKDHNLYKTGLQNIKL